MDRRIVFGKEIGFHEIHPGEELVGGIHAVEVFAGDLHEVGQAGPCPDKDGFVALSEQVVDGEGFSDHVADLHLRAQLFDVFALPLDDPLGQAELGNAVHQDASRFMEGFEDGDAMSLLDELAGRRQARRPRPDHGHFLSGRRREVRQPDVALLERVVRREPFQAADGDRLSFFGQNADDLALIFLGTDAAADGGQEVPFLDLVNGPDEIPVPDELDECRDVDIDGTARDAGGFLAVQAPGGFAHRLVPRVSEGDFLEVLHPELGVLFGHGFPLVGPFQFLLGFLEPAFVIPEGPMLLAPVHV